MKRKFSTGELHYLESQLMNSKNYFSLHLDRKVKEFLEANQHIPSTAFPAVIKLFSILIAKSFYEISETYESSLKSKVDKYFNENV